MKLAFRKLSNVLPSVHEIKHDQSITLPLVSHLDYCQKSFQMKELAPIPQCHECLKFIAAMQSRYFWLLYL